MTFISFRRLQWAAHIIRRDDNSLLKTITNGNFEGVRSRGRPKIRWQQTIERDINQLGIQNWLTVAKDKTQLNEMLNSVKARLTGA
jgi:hypothetical protein